MKKKFTHIFSYFFAAFLFFTALSMFSSCSYTHSSDRVEREKTERMLKEATAQIGMPNIVNFQQKKLLKMVYELADREDFICYVYLKSEYTGKLTFIGKSVGFGVPFSAQYTNPEKIVNVYGNKYILPQADPNGLFMPTSSSATWILMIDPKTNKPRPVYIEPEIVVSPFPLTDDTKE